MAISKKNKRKIIVNENDELYWTCTRHSSKDLLILRIMSEEKSLSQLICEFNHKDFWLHFKDGTGDKWNLSPQIVRQSIEYGLSNGWNPHKKESHFVVKNMNEILKIASADK